MLEALRLYKVEIEKNKILKEDNLIYRELIDENKLIIDKLVKMCE